MPIVAAERSSETGKQLQAANQNETQGNAFSTHGSMKSSSKGEAKSITKYVYVGLMITTRCAVSINMAITTELEILGSFRLFEELRIDIPFQHPFILFPEFLHR